MRTWGLAFLLLLSCTAPNPNLGSNETCSGSMSCPSGSGSYRTCASAGQTSCRLLASDGSSFSCVSCSSCVNASAALAAWCSGGVNGTNGGTTGGTNGTNGSTTGGTTGTNGGTTGGTNGSTTNGTTGGTSGGTTGSNAICPSLLIVLDISASMDSTLDNALSGPTKLDTVKAALPKMVNAFSTEVAFGLETFSNALADCNDGIDLLVEPAFGTAASINNQVASLLTNGSTNTGQAIARGVMSPALQDGSRPSRNIVLITDGQANCGITGQDDPAYTVGQISTAAGTGVHVFVVGLGVLDAMTTMSMDQMGTAGGVPSGVGGHSYYPADTPTNLDSMLTMVGNMLAGGACGR